MAGVQQINTFGDGLTPEKSTTNVNLAPEPFETPPTPCAILPYRRDKADYVHRAAIYERLESLAKPNGRVGLWGIGGAGKSQLALEFAYRLIDTNPTTFALWIHASTNARFEQNVKDLVTSLRIRGRQRPNADMFKLLQQWLNSSESAAWVLIVDNLDDRAMLKTNHVYDDNTFRIFDFMQGLSSCTHGCVIITSRDRDVALELVDEHELVTVGPMEKEHARALLTARLSPAIEVDKADQLSAALDYMPLALTQAAAYIKQRAPRFTVAAYLQSLNQINSQSSSLLMQGLRDLRRPRDAENAIFKTWQISFEHIRKLRSSAADLLALMCFFDRQAIPEIALRARLSGCSGDQARLEDLNDSFEQDVIMLRDYSFISVTTAEAATFDMHRLVQEGARAWLRSHGTEEHWKSEFVDRLHAAFPRDILYEYWPVCEILFPHVKSAITLRLEYHAANSTWADVLFRAAQCALQRGSPSDGVRMAERSQTLRERALGAQHEMTLLSTALTVRANWKYGDYKAAQVNGENLICAMRAFLGDTHFYTLDATSDLALVYTSQGNWRKAEHLHRFLLQRFTDLYGEDDANTLLSKNNLAVLYAYQGKHDLAARLHCEILEARKKTLGEDHPYTMSNMQNLAVSYWANERHDEAEVLFRSAHEKRRRLLGEDDLNTLTSLDSLAGVLRHKGDLMEAEVMSRSALKSREQILGEQHPDVLTSKANLALILHDAGQLAEAFDLNHECALATCAVLGNDHPSSETRVRRDLEWRDDLSQSTELPLPINLTEDDPIEAYINATYEMALEDEMIASRLASHELPERATSTYQRLKALSARYLLPQKFKAIFQRPEAPPRLDLFVDLEDILGDDGEAEATRKKNAPRKRSRWALRPRKDDPVGRPDLSWHFGKEGKTGIAR